MVEYNEQVYATAEADSRSDELNAKLKQVKMS